MTTLDAEPLPKAATHILPFMALAMMAGTTAGMLRGLSPVFAINLGATPAQVGFVASLESLGMAMMTLPAGVLVSRYGPRMVYVTASLFITAVYCLVPFSPSWFALAVGLCLGGACMPFRIVSVSSSFLERLNIVGRAKAGWYSGSGTIGTLLVGPALAAFLLTYSGPAAGYYSIAFLFGCMGIGGAAILSRHPSAGTMPATFTQSFAETGRLLRNPVVSAICTIELSTGIVFAFFSAFIVVAAITEVGLSEASAISIRMFEGLVAVGTMFVGGWLVKDRPLTSFYRVSLALITAGFMLLSIASTYGALVLATLLLGSGHGITSLINIMRLGAADVSKSRVASLQLFSSMGGAFLGALLGSLLTKLLGLHGMFISGAALYLLLSYRWCWQRPT